MNPMESFLKGGDKSPLVEDEVSGNKTGNLTFNKPSGFKLPEGVQEGEPFDAMATLKLVGGKLVLNELDGAPVEDEPEGDESEEESGEESPVQDESPEPKPEDASSDEDSEPSTEEPEADDEGEPTDFISAIEKKAKKLKK